MLSEAKPAIAVLEVRMIQWKAGTFGLFTFIALLCYLSFLPHLPTTTPIHARFRCPYQLLLCNMFSTDYSPRPQRGPSRPNSPRNHSRPKKKPSLTKQSSSSGWSWPRLLTVEVDIEDKSRKEPQRSAVTAQAEQDMGEDTNKGYSSNVIPNRFDSSQEDQSTPSNLNDQVERQGSEPPSTREQNENPPSPHHEYGGPSSSQTVVARQPSPTHSDGPLHDDGAITADKSPRFERGYSPVTSVRRVRTGSPSSHKTAQRVDDGKTPELVQLPDSPQEENAPSSGSNQLLERDPSIKDLQPERATEPVGDDESQSPKPDTGPERKARDNTARPNIKAIGSKSSSVSGNDGRPPGSFPGADNVFGEAAIPDEGENDGTELVITPKASEREDSPEPANAKNDKGGPHIKFKGASPSQPQADSNTAMSDHHPQGQITPDQLELDAEKAQAEPSRSTPGHPDSSSTKPGPSATEQTRRPSKEALRRTRKPSVYIPLSKVAEAKGKIEAANVQSPQSGVIVNTEERPSPRKFNEEPSGYLTRSSTKVTNEKPPDLPPRKSQSSPKPTWLGSGTLHQDPSAAEDIPITKSPLQETIKEKVRAASVTDDRESLTDEGPNTTPIIEQAPTSEAQVQQAELKDEQAETIQPEGAEITSVQTEQKSCAEERQSTPSPSPPSTPSQGAAASGQDDSSRDARTPEDVIHRISVPENVTPQQAARRRRKGRRRSTKMSLPPPKIFIQSPSSASEVPEPTPTPAAALPVSEYKNKSRSGTVVSVERTVNGASDKLSKKPVRKRSLYLRKVRNIAARKVVLNATLGRQMGERTKKRLRQLAKGEKLAKSQIPAQENAPDLPPLRKRQSFIRKARNLAATQAVLDVTLGRQVAAETKPVLRRMAKGEMVVIEEGHSFEVKQ